MLSETLYDMHCHLGFCDDVEAVAAGMRAAGLGGLCATVAPAEYRALAEGAATSSLWESGLRVGLGLHPWWVAGGDPLIGDGLSAEDAALIGCLGKSERGGSAGAESVWTVDALSMAEELVELVDKAQFIAEVGLDFAPRHVATESAQRTAFARVCQAARGKVMSVHAVRSAGAVLDMLEENNLVGEHAAGSHETNRGAESSYGNTAQRHASSAYVTAGGGAAAPGTAIIFHWFSGTSQELTRAISAGCYFSVNPRMLESKRGRAYVQAIPENRLLLESDLPEQGEAYDAAAVRALLEETLARMAELRKRNCESLAAIIAERSRKLLNR